jgi:hypothetical protein
MQHGKGYTLADIRSMTMAEMADHSRRLSDYLKEQHRAQEAAARKAKRR